MLLDLTPIMIVVSRGMLQQLSSDAPCRSTIMGARLVQSRFQQGR